MCVCAKERESERGCREGASEWWIMDSGGYGMADSGMLWTIPGELGINNSDELQVR